MSNFAEYRNKIYKREKLGQYASLKTNGQIKEVQTNQTTNTSIKMMNLLENQDSTSVISKVNRYYIKGFKYLLQKIHVLLEIVKCVEVKLGLFRFN